MPLNIILFLIYSLAVNETSAAALSKGDMFLGVLIETCSYKDTTGVPIENEDNYRAGGGIQRGRAPFVSSRKRGSRGRNPIERVSPSCVLLVTFPTREKLPGSGPGRPGSHRIEWQ